MVGIGDHKMRQKNHLAWDRLALSEIFGYNKSGKTKTECGKTVSYNLITNDKPSCEVCYEIWLDEQKLAGILSNEKTPMDKLFEAIFGEAIE